MPGTLATQRRPESPLLQAMVQVAPCDSTPWPLGRPTRSTNNPPWRLPLLVDTTESGRWDQSLPTTRPAWEEPPPWSTALDLKEDGTT